MSAAVKKFDEGRLAQILVAPGGTVRCVRSGSIADGDFPTIHALTR